MKYKRRSRNIALGAGLGIILGVPFDIMGELMVMGAFFGLISSY